LRHASSGPIAEEFKAALGTAAGATQGTTEQKPRTRTPHSKSHVHRVLSGTAPTPSWPWIEQFLRITSRAAGLSKQQFDSRREVARTLRDASLAEDPRTASPRTPVTRASAQTEVAQDLTVAVLRLKVDLERARHTETRLRFAIRDAHILTMTLWAVIRTLRDIISGHDVLPAHARRQAEGVQVDRLSEESRQAIDYTRAAQREADRALVRIRTLELWERARTEVQRLAQHPDAAAFVLGAADSGEPTPALVPQDFVAQPALDDIADALAKAHAVNERTATRSRGIA
jgi:hypothetical protein